MRKYKIPILSALFASALTIVLFVAFNMNEPDTPQIAQLPEGAQTSVLYTANSEGEVVPLDFTDISKQVMNAVVHINSIQEVEQQARPDLRELPDPFREFFRRFEQERGDSPQQRQGGGSGVIINSDGYIVTNNHVVANADEVNVTLYDNRSYKARIIGTDPTTDLALVQVEETGLPTIPMVDSKDIEVGEWVLAVGNPFNLTSTVTAGIVSAKSRSINILREQYAIESFIQTDAAINPGNSGGALVNLQGGLIGVNTAIASPTGTYAGYGFAIPSNIVNKVVSDLLEYGTVQRGYLGVVIQNVTGNFAEEEGLDVNEGVYIDSVSTGSAADEAGIEAGDVVIEIEGMKITQASQLQETVATHRPGEEVELVINRDGKIIERTAVLQSLEGATEIQETKRGKMFPDLGAEMATVSDEEAEELGIEGGVRITRLYAGILRQKTEVREGFIIIRINNQAVTTVDEFKNILEDTEGGVMLEGVYEGLPDVHYYAFGLD
ncbi:MAG: Do family serine endopeptidase [Tangfeifania sp.]